MNDGNNKKSMSKNKSKKTNIKKKIDVKKFENLEGKFLHIKVGTDKVPATSEQIEEIEKKVVSLFSKNNINCLTFVTHHATSITIIG